MSRRSQRERRQIKRFVDEEEEERPQKRQRRARIHSANIGRDLHYDERNRVKGLIRRYFLYQCSQSNLVRPRELLKLVPETVKGNARKNYVKTALAPLKKMLGFDISTAKGGQFAYSKEQCQNGEEVENEFYRTSATLRFLILSCVQLSGKAIEEKELMLHMEKLGLGPKKVTIVGKIKEFLAEMCKQGYLKKDKIEEPERTCNVYTYGPRIKLESDISRVGVYRFAHQLAKEEEVTEADDFLNQCEEEDDPKSDESDSDSD